MASPCTQHVTRPRTTRGSRTLSSSGTETRNSSRTTKRRANAEASNTPRKRTRSKATLKNPPSTAAKQDEEDSKPAPAETCCICMCDVEPDELAKVNGCDHHFCFGCIEKWSERENTCPLCKNRFNKIDRINKKGRKGSSVTKKVKQRDQRTDLVPGAALEGLLANFASRHPNPPNIARLIFSGMPDFGAAGFTLTQAPRLAGGHHRSLAANDEGEPWSSDEDDGPLTQLLRVMQSHQHHHNVMSVVRPVVTSQVSASRSYASNIEDRSAGDRAENPLEIEDDSDEDDDIEVVQVLNRSI